MSKSYLGANAKTNINQLKPKTPMTYDDKNDSEDHDGNDADDKY